MLIIIFIASASTPFWVHILGHVISNLLAYYLTWVFCCIALGILFSWLNVFNMFGDESNTFIVLFILSAIITVKLRSGK